MSSVKDSKEPTVAECARFLAQDLAVWEATAFNPASIQDMYPELALKFFESVELGLAGASVLGDLKTPISLEDKKIMRYSILSYLRPELETKIDPPLPMAVSIDNRSCYIG